MQFGNFRIGGRLRWAFGLVLLVSIVTDILALQGLGHIQGNMEKIVNENGVKIQIINDMATAVHVESRVIRTMVLLDDSEKRSKEEVKLRDALKSYQTLWDRLQQFPPSDAARAIRARMQQGQAETTPLVEKLIALTQAEQDEAATALLMNELIPASTRWLSAIDDNVTLQEDVSSKEYEEATESYIQARNTLVIAAAISVALSVSLASVITRSITRPLSNAITAAQGVAQGNLAVSLRPQGRDETATLVNALISMQKQLSQLVHGLRQNAAGLASASEQIAQGNQDLSARTEQQASALEQTAASMEELSATVQNNADFARQANELATAASAVAAQGGKVVAQVVDTMKGINDSSRQIVEIISVIDGIAFQTNILALNAAVEAARAGDQGRGFAVVATEVRALAGRSSLAAKEIKTLIQASVERVTHGTRLVDKAGSTMADVVNSIQKVTTLMTDISVASREQSQGVAEVTEAVGQMDQTTQQNAAMVEEMAAAGSLNAQAQELVASVAVFTFAGETLTAQSQLPGLTA